MTAEELFDRNQKLVSFCYKKYVKYCNFEDYDDVYQEGMLALWQAAQKFDESKGFKFSTYAMSYIMGGMKKYLLEKCNTIRIPYRVWKQNDTDLINRLQHIASLDARISYEDDTTLAELIPDNNQSIGSLSELNNSIAEFLKTITNETHRKLMTEYYSSIFQGTKINQVQLGRNHGMVQSQVSKLLNRYKSKFKEFMYS